MQKDRAKIRRIVERPDYALIYRTLSLAKRQALSVGARAIAVNINMALLQTILNWEGVEADDLSTEDLTALILRKEKIALDLQ